MLFTIKLYHDTKKIFGAKIEQKTGAKTATMLVTTRIVAVLFFLNCKKWDYTIEIYRSQAKLRYCEQ